MGAFDGRQNSVKMFKEPKVVYSPWPPTSRKQVFAFIAGIISAVFAFLLLSTLHIIEVKVGQSSVSPAGSHDSLTNIPIGKLAIGEADYSDADLSAAAAAAASGTFTDVTGSSDESTHATQSGIEGAKATGGVATNREDGGVCGQAGCDNLGPLDGGSYAQCHEKTRSGHCTAELFRLYDDAYRSLWPARVDLLIRSYVSDKFFLLEMLFDSIEQMWPKGIGEVILVLDEKDQLVRHIVPHWVKVYYEKNYLKLPGKIFQQWSYLWADNYTTAPYIAVVDDDVIFNLKVTPGLLFNLTEGKPYVIGSRQKQMNHWVPSTRFLVGKQYYFANFMVQLPFVFPRDVLPKFRKHVGDLHAERGGTLDSAFKYFSVRGPKFERTQIAHTTLGNYMWAFTNDEVHWALEWTKRMPIPRVGVHLPYSMPFRKATNFSDLAPRVVKLYVELAGYYSHEAVCNAFPKGELDGCEDVLRYPQRQIWQYVMDWYDWPLIKKKVKNATFVYDHYKDELWCMYWKAVQAPTTSEQWKLNPAAHRKQLVDELRRDCIIPHSN